VSVVEDIVGGGAIGVVVDVVLEPLVVLVPLVVVVVVVASLDVVVVVAALVVLVVPFFKVADPVVESTAEPLVEPVDE
jgi:nitrate/nitrite transporter NarK